tara:strand:+ start:1012 stop:1113 length:102 start_codon:yes stop_codon:yes gene_type:complete
LIWLLRFAIGLCIRLAIMAWPLVLIAGLYFYYR